MVVSIFLRGNMFKLSNFSIQAAVAAAAMLFPVVTNNTGAGTEPAEFFPALTANTASINGLTGAQAAGQPALESLNGVAVDAVALPPEAGR